MNITRVETELIAIKKQLFSIDANTTGMGEYAVVLIN